MVDIYFTQELEDSRYNFVDSGWLPLYRRLSFKDEESGIKVFHYIYCYLIADYALGKCISYYRPDIEYTDRVISPEEIFRKGVITLITMRIKV